MKITKQELKDMGACLDGLKRFIAQTNHTDDAVEVASLVGGLNTYSDLLWLAGEKLSKERIVRFACDCALINIELIKPYTDKYDMIVDFLRDPTAAYAAAYAAANAAAVANAYAVANAAAVANAVANATTAARAASWAARAASWAATTAARAAAGSQDEINVLLVKLFEGEL